MSKSRKRIKTDAPDEVQAKMNMRARTEAQWASRPISEAMSRASVAVEQAMVEHSRVVTGQLMAKAKRVDDLNREVQDLRNQIWHVQELFPNHMDANFDLRSEVGKLLNIIPNPIPEFAPVELPEVIEDPLGEEN